jgi:hypothetical protein
MSVDKKSMKLGLNKTTFYVIIGFDVNLDQYKDTILSNLNFFEEEYMPWQEYRSLSESEQVK